MGCHHHGHCPTPAECSADLYTHTIGEYRERFYCWTCHTFREWSPQHTQCICDPGKCHCMCQMSERQPDPPELIERILREHGSK